VWPSKNKYSCMFPAMISEWRRQWRHSEEEFAFGFVQLGNYLGYRSAEMRWEQTANFGYAPNKVMPSTFMAVSLDIPDHVHQVHTRHTEVKAGIKATMSHQFTDRCLPLGSWIIKRCLWEERVSFARSTADIN